ncbi:FctA domain-containing protein [Bifidobacterium longum]|uniref:Spy0128 family protein n=1 Tax=Bifidobacterium longum TaxID=216816 RepID=UPI0011074026|nr:FctA domain-containing protein [Bifidobacterium longum]MDB6656995.1 FctA domain-containing protein [Bifidobacterium longum]MDB6664203.1 FctA domain-containing protein [Bifidobacterium longum]MDB6667317.1 FctA domain-containing protein [Bifidobacterium longum]MDB6667793.1 FctA domain-containing protein [Bifidobacterium longum]MDB6672949.1 FctA domain-containing protein [Bifidobacterium longum]
MKPGLRKVAALILASVTLFGSGASAVSAAYADDTTMGRPTRIQAEPDKTTTGGDEAATKPDAGSGDEAGTGADEQSDTGAPAQSAPQADAGQAAPDVTVHDMLDTDSATVSRLRLTDRITGTAPFDADNARGDDKDENNDIVRSYDTVTYDYEYTLTPDSTMDYYRRTRVGFRFELPYPKDKVTFDAEKMGWVDHTPGYEPKLTTETIDGIVTQVYTCYRLLEPTSQSPTVNPGTGSIGLSVAVKGAPHGYRFHPTVKAWPAWDASNPTNTGTHKRAEDTPKDVTVSAKLNLNVRMVNYGNVDRGVFDFSSGAANAPNRTEGKVTGLGWGIALVTEMRWPDRTKGLKGLEAPSGRITYRLRLSNQYSDDTKAGTKHPMERRWQPLLYDYGHIDNEDSKYGRTFAWMGDLQYRAPGVADRADGNDRVARGDTTVTTTTGGQGTDVTVSFDGYDTSVFPIHNKLNGTHKKCSTDYMTSDCSTMQVGAIHTDVLQFITPTSRDGRTVAQYYGNVDQTANITMDDMGLTATGVSGDRLATAEDNSNQAATGDDHAGSAVTVRMPGTYSTRIRYTYWNNSMSWNDAGTSGEWMMPDYGNGSDSLIQGSKLRLQIGHNIIINSEGDAEVMGMGLVKLDPNSIEPVDDHPDTQPTIPMNVFTWGMRAAKRRNAIPYWYAVKKDGTKWKDYREQRDTKISGLDYYPTLNEAKRHGTIVGMLFEDHNTVDPTGTSFNRTFTPIVALPARILDTARIGTVAPIVAETAYWTRNSLARTANLNADAPDTQWQQWSDSLTTRLPEYANSVKPDLTYSGDTYRPATFDENGVYQGGDTADTLKGDSLYIAGETPHIAKQVAQTNEAGNVKTVYDLDKEQRAVDWKLTATADTSTTTDGGQYTTDYIITDTLPKGLAYVDGSMTVGGQYTQHTPDKGTVTGGTPVTPTIVVNKDGTTTMTIRVNGARADSGTQTVIHYSTTIGDASDPDHDVRNNDSFTNHATIQSKRNMAPPLAPKAQIADATVRVSRTRATALATRADPLLNDINRPLGYRNMLGNFSKDEKTDPYAVDIMPYRGLNQSNYHGDYVMAGLTVKAGAGASMNGVKVYFTTDQKWRNVDATKITREQVTQWTEATVNATTGKVTIPDGYSKPVAWAFTSPSLPANARYDFSLSIKPTGNSASDMYVNRWADGDNKVDAVTQVVERKVNGVAWFDTNHDGVREDTDRLLPDVNVTLVDANGRTVTSVDGKPCTATTDRNGHYEIGSIPAGSGFKLRFTPKTGTAWHGQNVTVKNAKEASEATDSDSDRENDSHGDMVAGVITLKPFPALDEMMSAVYEDPNEDHGMSGTLMPATPATFKAVKVLDGRPNGAWTDRDRYVADITALDGAPANAVPSTITFADNRTQTLQINSNAFPTDGVYRYQVRERRGDNPGVAYDDRTWVLTVTVQDDLTTFTRRITANTTCDGVQSDAIQFTNTYAPKDVTVSLTARKTFDNADASHAKLTDFQFQLFDNERAVGVPVQTVNADRNGDVRFQPLTFTASQLKGNKSKTFTYTVREIRQSAGGVNYDSHMGMWQITVTDDLTGQLKAQTRTNAAYPTTFTNTYQAKPVSVQFRAHKTLNDPDHTGIQLQAGQYEFKCVEDKTGGQVGTAKTNDQRGDVLFDAISYTRPGTYDYTIRETPGDRGGITYDTTKHHVRVTVTDDGEGRLLADVKYDGGTAIPEFTNTYRAQPATDTPTAVKAVSASEGNHYKLKGDDFTFTLHRVTAPDGVTAEADQTKTNDARGNIRFDQLSFPLPGTYVYTVSERDVTVPGVTKDGTVTTITYTVKDVGHAGRLKVVDKTITRSDGKTANGIRFDNTYNPKGVGCTLGGVKTIINADTATNRIPQDGEFTFALTSHDGAPMPEGSKDGVKTVTNTGTGFTFGRMDYDKPGTYVYTVTEQAGRDPTIGYSTQAYDVTVTVTDQGGMLSATADRQATDVRFDNTYTPTPVGVTVKADKRLTGRDLNDGEFAAELKDSDGNLLQAKRFARVPRDAQSDKANVREGEGTLEFDKLTFDRAGVYTYTVTEQDGNLGGVTYDRTVHTVTVTVTEDAKTHRLVAAVSYSNGEGGEEGILFRNTYQPGNVMVELAARKNLTGRGLKADEFEFELVDKDGKVIDSARNDKDGDIRFKPLTYSRDNNGIDDCGEHRYVIRERNTGETNVTYDRTEHHVTVTVGDDLQGNLTAKVEYDPTDDTAKDSGAMPATPTDKTDKTDKTKGDAVGDGPSTTPGMVTTTGTRPEFTNSYIPPATPAIVKTIRQLAKTGVSTPTVALAAFTLLGVGLMLFRRRGNQTETARHRK